MAPDSVQETNDYTQAVTIHELADDNDDINSDGSRVQKTKKTRHKTSKVNIKTPTPKLADSHDTSENISCQCNLLAAKRKVSKSGPNNGRLFFVCPNSENSNCNFFLWADEEEKNGHNSGFSKLSTFPALNNGIELNAKKVLPRQNSSNENSDSTLKCDCNLIAKVASVKGGSNVGRPYATCVKTSSTRCKFYVWLDDEQNNKDPTSKNSASKSSNSFLNYFPQNLETSKYNHNPLKRKN